MGDQQGRLKVIEVTNVDFSLRQFLLPLMRAIRARGHDVIGVCADGPFLEAKEYLGGFYLVDVQNKARAIELAAQIPDAAIEGLGVEVRQVMFADGQLEA